MDPERSTASTIGRWVGWLAVLALTAAVVVGTVAVIGQVTERPLTRAAATPSATPPSAASVVAAQAPPTSPFSGPLPDVAGRPVPEAQAALEGVGAQVHLVDASGRARPVQLDWVACGSGPMLGATDTSSDVVNLGAVPAGEPCA